MKISKSFLALSALLLLLFALFDTTTGFSVMPNANSFMRMKTSSSWMHRRFCSVTEAALLSSDTTTGLAVATISDGSQKETTPLNSAVAMLKEASESVGMLPAADHSQKQSSYISSNLAKMQQSLNQLLKLARSYDENKFYKKLINSMIRAVFDESYSYLASVDPAYSDKQGVLSFSQAIRKAKKLRDMGSIARAFRNTVNLPVPEANLLLNDCTVFIETYVPEAFEIKDFLDLNLHDIVKQFKNSTVSFATRDNIFLAERLVKWFEDSGVF